MKIFHTAILFVIGVISIAFDEASKSVEELAKSMGERRAHFVGKEHQAKQALTDQELR
jgi:ABC-type sulfate transport system permease component